MKKIIFYSWQSDLPNKSNRSFIEETIEATLRNLKKNKSIIIIPVLDRDTQGISGSPDIENSILSKINEAQIFIADVSIINKVKESDKNITNNFRLCPNPNVIFELGYAIKCLGLNNVILVLNSFYGSPESLPFDIRGKRVITYNLDPEFTNFEVEKEKLISNLENALTEIIEGTQGETEIKAELFLFWSINKRSSHFKLSITLDPMSPMELILKLLLISYYEQPNKKLLNKFSNDLKDYDILDVTNKRWIEPKYLYDLNNELIAFVPISDESFKMLDKTGKAKAISFAIETFQ